MSLTVAMSIPLLRLFDVSNIAHGTKGRGVARGFRVAVASVFVLCNAVVLVACIYAAVLDFEFHQFQSDSSIASCGASKAALA